MGPEVQAFLNWVTAALWMPMTAMWWQFMRLNGRIHRLEQWSTDHEAHDERRESEVREDIRSIRYEKP